EADVPPRAERAIPELGALEEAGPTGIEARVLVVRDAVVVVVPVAAARDAVAVVVLGFGSVDRSARGIAAHAEVAPDDGFAVGGMLVVRIEAAVAVVVEIAGIA